jgi:hypothetical protein
MVTTRDVVGKGDVVPSQYRELAQDVKPGDRVLLDDGKLELKVIATDGASEVRCRVVQGGRLKDKKGMNLPGVAVSTPAVTEKDKADALFATSHGVDFVAPRPSTPSTRSSTPPTASWWPAVTSVWRCCPRRCRSCRASSCASRSRRTSP